MSDLKFAITQPYPCNYLTDKKEQLLVCMPPKGVMEKAYYEWLIIQGFRRSGEQVYRPHCSNCNACKSVRILVNEFVSSKSQRRVWQKAKEWDFNFTSTLTSEHYDLYQRYITKRHADGTMYPPSRKQLEQFVQCHWQPAHFLEARQGGHLAALAVTDIFDNALSALYTFFDPELSQFSPGTLMILHQINQAKALNKPYVYLGYQVDACAKMAYKINFLPQEQFIGGKWVRFDKKNI